VTTWKQGTQPRAFDNYELCGQHLIMSHQLDAHAMNAWFVRHDLNDQTGEATQIVVGQLFHED
jgi:hypothetical protein